MILPNSQCAAFCYWLLNISWQKLSGSQRSLVQLVETAALAQTEITNQQWANFNKFTAWRFPFYQVYASLSAVSPFLLDQFPAAACAFSFRKLLAAYAGPCCQVRRASDNAVLDIYFQNNVLDLTQLSSFCAATSGYVRTWYDQTGNSNHAVQVTANAQPLLFTAGSVIMENTKPACLFDGINDGFQLTSSLAVDASFSVSQVFNKLAAGNVSLFFATDNGGGGALAVFSNGGNDIYSFSSTHFINSSSGTNPGFQETIAAVNLVSTGTILKGNTPQAITTTASARFNQLNTIAAYPAGGEYSDGTGQEIIFWQADKSASIVAIQTNVKDYYGIP